MKSRDFFIVVITSLSTIGFSAGYSFGHHIPQTVRMTLQQSMGATLKGYRAGFALTQGQLAGISGVSSTIISRIERGLDSGSTVQKVKLVQALDSVFKARFDPGTEAKLMALIVKARTRTP